MKLFKTKQKIFMIFVSYFLFLGMCISVCEADTQNDPYDQKHFFIKFKDEGPYAVTVCPVSVFEKKLSLKDYTTDKSSKLDELIQKYVKDLRPLFPTEYKKAKSLNPNGIISNTSLKQLCLQKIENQKRKFAKRTKRISSHLKHVSLPDLYNWYVVEVRDGVNVAEAILAFNRLPHVKVERARIPKLDSVPNDPMFPLQWALHNTGQDFPIEPGRLFDFPQGGKIDADIDATEAWDIQRGREDVVVAVIDSGVDYQHPDIDDNMWINQEELNGQANFDDDNNNYVDDIYGYNFLANRPDPMDDTKNGHATHVAGIIAAEGNNGIGITGVAWNAKIMALKFVNKDGFTNPGTELEAIYYAVDNGADIISNSWGWKEVNYNSNTWPDFQNFDDYSRALKEAVDYAVGMGVLVVAAAGNDGDLIRESNPQYPAAFDNVIGVAATNSMDYWMNGSDWGAWVDVAAPGEDILSLKARSSTRTAYDDQRLTSVLSGTSMAAPQVSGLAALLMSEYPEETVDQITARILENTDPLSHDFFNRFGIGRINAYKALAAGRESIFQLKNVTWREIKGDGDQIPEAGEQMELVVEIENVQGNPALVRGQLSSQNEFISSILKANSDFGVINSQQKGNNSNDPFVFEIGQLPFGMPVNMTMIINQGELNSQTFDFQVHLGVKRIKTNSNAVLDFSIYENKIVWIEMVPTESGNFPYEFQIFVHDLETGQTTQITDQSMENLNVFPQAPAINQNNIVWHDNREGGLGNEEIFAYNLTSPHLGTFQISNALRGARFPSVWNNLVVWQEPLEKHLGIYLYDLEKRQPPVLLNPNPVEGIGFEETGVEEPISFIAGGKIIRVAKNYIANYKDKVFVHTLNAGEGELEQELSIRSIKVHEPRISGNNIVWWSGSSVILYNLDSNIETNLKLNFPVENPSNLMATKPDIYGHYTVWQGSPKRGEDIYFYDTSTSEGRFITRDYYKQKKPRIYRNRIVWIDSRMGNPDIFYTEIPEPKFIRGDSNQDAKVDISDVIYSLNYLFKNGPDPACLDAADANDDGQIDISDAVRILLYLFSGQTLPLPNPNPGLDPTVDNLGCAQGL